MENSKTTGTSTPTAHVTVNKNRLKQYHIGGFQQNNVSGTEAKYYLKQGQTFEIELFNPTQDVIKAEININGDKISGGGLIIKPGERIYLERYIDSNHKFIFETYEVEDSEEVSQAIVDNGLVEVKFYREIKVSNFFTIPMFETHYDYYYNSNNTNTQNIGTSLSFSSLDSNGVDNKLTTSTFTNDMDMVFEENSVNTKTKETGRVGKGEESKQKFMEYMGSFSTYAFHTESFKIEPMSEQPLSSKEVHNMRKYCGQCGAKTKAKDNFCRMCGDRL